MNEILKFWIIVKLLVKYYKFSKETFKRNFKKWEREKVKLSRVTNTNVHTINTFPFSDDESIRIWIWYWPKHKTCDYKNNVRNIK